LREALEASEKGLQTALISERCQGLSIFQGSDRQIVDFLQDGDGVVLRASIELMRVDGILQRDAGYYLNALDRIVAASTNASRDQAVAQFAQVASEVEQNRHLAGTKSKDLNIISCLVFPGIIRAIQIDLWSQTLGEVTMAALAMERYRQETGHLPPGLQALVPHYLPNISQNPYTGQPICFSLLPKGYEVYAPNRHANQARLGKISESESDEIAFRVER